MSISVKSIAVSIDGKQSEQFNIELNGSKFVMEEFSLTQHLLEPCFLSFNLHKDAEEDINDIEFNVPASIIGKEVTWRASRRVARTVTLSSKASSLTPAQCAPTTMITISRWRL